MKRKKLIISGASSLVFSLADEIQKKLTEHHWKVQTSDMVGYGRNFTIRKGNFLLGFFGCNRMVRLAICNQEEELIADLQIPLLGLHATMLIVLLLMIPPFCIISFVLSPFMILFILAHITGLIMQIVFLKRLMRFIEDFCKKNISVPQFCSRCGEHLNADGKCIRCESQKE